MIRIRHSFLLVPAISLLSACGGGSSSGGGGGTPEEPTPGNPAPIAATCDGSRMTITDPGTTQVTVPEGCTSLSAVAIGGGGGNGGVSVNDGKVGDLSGDKGALSRTSVAVVPGEAVTVIVGRGGQRGINVGFLGRDERLGAIGGAGGAGANDGQDGTNGEDGIAIIRPYGGGGGGGGGGSTRVFSESAGTIVHAAGGDGGAGHDCGLLCSSGGTGGQGGSATGGSGNPGNNATAHGQGGVRGDKSGGGGAAILTFTD